MIDYNSDITSNYHLISQQDSSIHLNCTNSNYILLKTNYDCLYKNGTLFMYDNTFISTSSGAKIKYYGGDLQIIGNNSFGIGGNNVQIHIELVLVVIQYHLMVIIMNYQNYIQKIS